VSNFTDKKFSHVSPHLEELFCIKKFGFLELGCGGMDWIDLATDRDRWWGLVNAVMNLQVP
jgi:hypothetical protein